MCTLYSSSTGGALSLLNLLPGFQQSVGFKMLAKLHRWKQRFMEVHTRGPDSASGIQQKDSGLGC